MSKPKINPTPEPVVQSDVDVARATIGRIQQELAALDTEARTAESEVAPIATAAATARQRRTGLVARLLNIGGAEPDEVAAIDRELDEVARIERRAALVTEAKQTGVADREARRAALVQQTCDARRALVVAQFDALQAEIMGTRLPELRQAAEQFRLALGSVIGAGRVHCALAQVLREQHGVSRQPLGVERAVTIHDLPVVGFGVADGGRVNMLRVDATEAAERAFVEGMRGLG
jgi:hypothetical protein